MTTLPRSVAFGGKKAGVRCCSCMLPHRPGAAQLLRNISREWPLRPPKNRRWYAHESQSFLETSKHTASGSKLTWPTPNSANPYEIPTPYEIFHMTKGDAYSKRRFYELVKLYHPDRAQASSPMTEGGVRTEYLSHSARLERYRMVIAANELLSDARRRKAYDQDGIGWDGKPEFGPSRPRWAEANNRYWSGFDDNVNETPKQNATWEDWEQWHMRTSRTQGEQGERFTSNGTFVVLLLLAVSALTLGESYRIHGQSRTVVQQVDDRHDTNSKELVRRRRESQDMDARDERTRRFLIIRGPVGNELELRPVGQEKEGSVFVSE